jgi:hypothetical protein
MGQSGTAVGLPRARGTEAIGGGRAAHARPGLLPRAGGRVAREPINPYQRMVALADWIGPRGTGMNST